MTPGAPFGPGGEEHVRLCFCSSESTINEAFDRLDVLWSRKYVEGRLVP
ncbi:MAG: hypothetical protein JRJ84_06335 [Deltaproteobacteria bacterium]|nr:hypothetical protein [Deltaproteobacteria bacterium]